MVKTTCASIGAVVAVLLGACGSDGIGNDSGSGSGTLLVNAQVEYDEGDGVAAFRVRVMRAGLNVSNAAVTMESEFGEVILVYGLTNEYEGTQAGWAEGYRVRVSAGENDHLVGSIAAPGPGTLTSPDPRVPFDPHLAEHGLVQVRWDGEATGSARVRTLGFDSGPIPDDGSTEIPAMFFSEPQQEIEIDRGDTIFLEGGVPGSELTAAFESRTAVMVVNPF